MCAATELHTIYTAKGPGEGMWAVTGRGWAEGMERESL